MGRRRTYTKEFKMEAVKLADSKGFRAASRDLGINDGVLHRWRRQLEVQGEQAFPGHRKMPEDSDAGMERENARLREENAILKKAVGIFSSRPGLGTDS